MISAEFLQTVCGALANGNAQRPGIDQTLRTAYPGVPFTLCDDNDIPSRLKPLATGEGFALYGISSGGHCATLAADIDASTGLAIALIEDEKDN